MINAIEEMPLGETDLYEGGHGLLVSLTTHDGYNGAAPLAATFGMSRRFPLPG